MNCWFCGAGIIDPREHAASHNYGDITRWRTTEHLIPRSKGGSDAPENVVDACFSCNATKSGKTLEEYRQFLYDKDPRGQARKHIQKALAAWLYMPVDVQRDLLRAIAYIEEIHKPVLFVGETL